MNKKTRKQLAKIAEYISGIQAELECIKDTEQESFDNLPEGLQGAEMGEKFEENVSDLEDIISELEDIASRIGEI